MDVAHSDVLTGDFSRLLRTNTLSGSSCLYPGEPTARPCQQGTVFRPGTIIRNQAGNIIGGQPYANNVVPQSEWNGNANAFLKLIGALSRTGAGPVPGGNNPELVRVFVQDQYRLRKRQEVLRVDYSISSMTNFFFRWVDDSQDEDQGVGIFSSSSFPYTPQFRKKPGSSWSWNLFVANGHVYPQVDKFDWGTTWAQRPLLFRNKDGRSFTLMPAASGSGLAAVRGSRSAN